MGHCRRPLHADEGRYDRSWSSATVVVVVVVVDDDDDDDDTALQE